MDDVLFLFEDNDPGVLSILKQELDCSTHYPLYKVFILKSIRDRTTNFSVPDSILDSLILLETLDREHGIPPSDAMRDAFRVVAVHCTHKCLVLSWSSYFDAWQRIWKSKVNKLEDSGVSNLFSPALAQFRMDIIAAQWDKETLLRLFPNDTLDEALKCIEVYLIEAFSSLTPAFPRLTVVPSAEPTADHVASASVRSEGKGRHEGAHFVVDLEEDQSSSGEVNELLPAMLNTGTVGFQVGPTDTLHETLEVAEPFASNMEIESLHEEDSDKDKDDPTRSVSPATHHCNDKGKLNPRENSHSSPGRHEGSVNIVDLDQGHSSSREVNELLPTVLKTRIPGLQARTTDFPYESLEASETFASNTAIGSLHKEDSDKDIADPTTLVSPATHHCNDKGKRTMRENSQRYKVLSSHRRRKGPLIISDLEEDERVASDMGNENLHATDTVEHSNKDNGDPTNYCTDKGKRFAMANSRTIRDPNSKSRQYEEPAVIADTVEDRPTCRKFVLVSTPEVEKVRELFKSSVASLLAAATDPLPQAFDIADGMASYITAAAKLQTEETIKKNHDKMDRNVQAKRGEPVETVRNYQERMDRRVPAPSIHHPTEPSQAKDGNEAFIRPKKVRKTSSFERNNTAHSVEWEGTMDGSVEGTSGSSNRCTLPTPTTKPASPVKQSEPLKWVRKRKVNRWTDAEEKALIEGVCKYGNQWKIISSKYGKILSRRTQVDLKDKWRVLTRK